VKRNNGFCWEAYEHVNLCIVCGKKCRFVVVVIIMNSGGGGGFNGSPSLSFSFILQKTYGEEERLKATAFVSYPA
jgi:hypothetical protein